jgi:hypothetical protein
MREELRVVRGLGILFEDDEARLLHCVTEDIVKDWNEIAVALNRYHSFGSLEQWLGECSETCANLNHCPSFPLNHALCNSLGDFRVAQEVLSKMVLGTQTPCREQPARRARGHAEPVERFVL